METDAINALVQVRKLTKHGLSLVQLRRFGGNLYFDEMNWYDLARSSRISPRAALGILLLWHLVTHHVLIESDALSLLTFYRADVARYAEQAWETLPLTGDAAQVPIVMLEIMDGRWARVSNVQRVFDIKEQALARNEDLLALRSPVLYSHSVCLLPLLLWLRVEDTDDDEEQGDTAEDAE